MFYSIPKQVIFQEANGFLAILVLPVLTVSADPGQLLQDEGEEGPVQGVWGSHWQSQGRGRKEDNKLYFLNLENCKMISQGMFNRLSDAPASLKPVVSLIKQTQIAEITTELISKNENFQKPHICEQCQHGLP